MPTIIAEVSDKIPSVMQMFCVCLVLAVAAFAVARINKWLAACAVALSALLLAGVGIAIYSEAPAFKQAVVTEQGSAYFVLAMLCSTLPLFAALTGAFLSSSNVRSGFPSW